jgi:hypothetical protein
MRNENTNSNCNIPIEWFPGKFRVIRLDPIPEYGMIEYNEMLYKILFKFTQAGHYKDQKNKTLFTSTHFFRICYGHSSLFRFEGEIQYNIKSEQAFISVELMLLLVNRTHLLFAEEFEIRKKKSGLESFNVPDYCVSEIKNSLQKLLPT